MRVVELADDLGVESDALLRLLRTLRILVPDEDAVMADEDVSLILARLERERRAGHRDVTRAIRAAIEEAKPAAGRRRRRRRASQLPPRPQPEAQEAEAAEEPPARAAADSMGADAEAPSAEAVPVTEPSPDGPVVPEASPVQPLADELRAQVPEAGEHQAQPEEHGTAVVEEPTVPESSHSVRPAKTEPTVEATSTPGAAAPEPVRHAAPEGPARVIRRPRPAASSGAAGQVRVQAEGYTSDGQRRKRQKKKGRKRQRVDQSAVQENIQRVMAELKGGGRKRRRKATVPKKEQREAAEEEARQEKERDRTTVRVNEFLTVSELSELVDVGATEIIGSAFKNLGLMVTINQRLDFDQIELLLDEFGFTAVREEEYGSPDRDESEADAPEDLLPRAPVVTVMGHVDHGKTLLLDRIRSTNVVAGESGGITQHIGAYHVKLSDDRSITFLDTPGHAAFTAMRARGAEVTDIVVLVIAANDSVMPQTKEAISHARSAGVPIVVAVNKCDLPSADPMGVKQALLQQGIQVEDFGGDVLSADISAKTGDGIDDLLEKVLLQADLLELSANPNRDAVGIVIEARLDIGKGPVVSVLVEKGTLNVGDSFLVGLFEGRVRAMLDERGHRIGEATPGIPVQILGTAGVPRAGDTLQVMAAERASEIAQSRMRLEREKQLRIKERGVKLGDFSDLLASGQADTLPLIIKADVDGSVQALSDALEQIGTSEVKVQIAHRAVGAVNEEDVLLAGTSGAVIIGFRVRPNINARKQAERDGVDIRVYDVIYEAVDDVRAALEGMLAPETRESVVGTAEVRELFRVSRVGTIAGSYVLDGTIDRRSPVRLVRDGIVVYEGEISSLKRFKDDTRAVREGFECGIGIANFNDIKVGDVVECYSVEEVARTLTGAAG